MSSLLIKPIVQHHRSRVSPVLLQRFSSAPVGKPYGKGPHSTHKWKKKLRENRRFLESERASYGDDRVWEFRNHLELVKESEAWDGGQQPGKKLGFKHRSAEGAGDTTGPSAL